MLATRTLYLPSSKTIKSLSSKVNYSTSPIYKEHNLRVKDYEINYLKVGRGPHHVFCAGGAMSTIWSSFEKQIIGFDYDKFSLVVWDPPGHGKIVARDNKETWEIYFSDADYAYEMMKALQISRYSVLGWSNGGLVSLLLASRYPNVINKAVTWGTGTFVLPHEIQYYKNLRNVNQWPQPLKEELIKLYGEENFIKKLNEFVDAMLTFYDSRKTYCDEIKRIRCPTLLLHGAKDPVVDIWHLKYLQKLIPNSRTHLYPDGKHNIHIKYADDFNKRVQEFLLMK